MFDSAPTSYRAFDNGKGRGKVRKGGRDNAKLPTERGSNACIEEGISRALKENRVGGRRKKLGHVPAALPYTGKRTEV